MGHSHWDFIRTKPMYMSTELGGSGTKRQSAEDPPSAAILSVVFLPPRAQS